MSREEDLIKRVYAGFNSRDMDGVLADSAVRDVDLRVAIGVAVDEPLESEID